MFTRIRNLHPVTGVVVGVVATLVLSGTAMAVTDASFTYSTTKTGYLTIDAMDLAPRGQAAMEGYVVDIHTSQLLELTEGGGCYNTGVNLPQNARITTVLTYYSRGASGSGTAVLHLMRNHQLYGGSDYLVYENLPDTDGARSSATYTVPNDRRTVWNNVYSYGFAICLGPGDYFAGTRITYTYTNAGD